MENTSLFWVLRDAPEGRGAATSECTDQPTSKLALLTSPKHAYVLARWRNRHHTVITQANIMNLPNNAEHQ